MSISTIRFLNIFKLNIHIRSLLEIFRILHEKNVFPN